MPNGISDDATHGEAQDWSSRNPVPLSEVRLRNFKSVQSADVELRMLTTIVGRNSSGKSTLLQSLRALSQAVRDGWDGVEFPLEGDLIRLGKFSDVLSFNASGESPTVSIGFTVCARADVPSPNGVACVVTAYSWDGRLTGPEFTERGHTKKPTLDSPQFAIMREFRASMTCVADGNVSTHVELDVSDLGPGELDVRFCEGMPGISGYTRDVISGVDSSVIGLGRTYGKSLQPEVQLWDAWVQLQIQEWLLVNERALAKECSDWDHQFAGMEDDFEYDGPFCPETAIECAADDVIEELIYFLPSSGRSQSSQKLEQLAQVERAKRHMPTRSFEAEREYANVTGKPRPLTPLHRNATQYPHQDDDEEQFRDAVAFGIAYFTKEEFELATRKQLQQRGWLDIEEADWDSYAEREAVIGEWTPGTWRACPDSRIADELFARLGLQYIGPLRESPDHISDIDTAEHYPKDCDRKTFIGPKGQLMANVLGANQRSVILAPTLDGPPKKMSLAIALNTWLAALGVVEAAFPESDSIIGDKVTVRARGADQVVELTSVGVGVSQVLPVLLQCLIAPPGSVVLLEQPELHLHPAMQLQLADFLLACARSGRQIIVETHSEHLVNRLRRHVAEDLTDDTARLVQLLFAEQEDGVTTYRQSDINAMGGLSEDWPSGFLDVGSDEAGKLLRTNLQRSLRQSNEPSVE